jgi:hypothetical protein
VPHIDVEGAETMVCGPEEYQPLVYAQGWLHCFGSHIRFLRQVCIDVGLMYFMMASVRIRYVEFDLLPIVRLLWNNPQATFEITFGQHVGRNVEWSVDDATDDTSAGQEPEVDSAVVIHNVFQCLIKDDVLSLKQYAYSNYLLKRLLVLPASRQGIVKYSEGYRPSSSYQMVITRTLR